MTFSKSRRQLFVRTRSRTGLALRGLLVVVATLVAVIAIGWFALTRLSLSSEESGPMMATVERALFAHDITERGNIESSNNVEITCKVRSREGRATILEVVPEGTIIKPEDCVPENVPIALSAIMKLDQRRQEQQRKKAALAFTGQGSLAEEGRQKARGEGNGSVAQEGNGSATDEADADESGDGSVTTQIHSNGEGSNIAGLHSEALDDAETGQQSETDEDEYSLQFEDIKDKMVLVKLNSKEFEDQLLQKQIVCENSAAAVIQAEAAYQTALISKQEYLEGKYKEERQNLTRQRVQAQEDKSRADEYLAYSEEVFSKGFISENELATKRFDVKKYELAAGMVQIRIDVLETYTRTKILEQLNAAIAGAQARLLAAQRSYRLDLDQLKEIGEQVANCTIFAPHPGQVVYASETGGRRSEREIVIEPGATIWQRQTILRLPDPTSMQVKTKINEAKVALIQPGMKAVIRLEASTNEPLGGEVTEVAEYPAPTHHSEVKEYEVIIKINGLDENPRNDLRAGFTADVNLRVAEQPDALQLPIQSVLEHGGRHYVVVPAGHDEWEAKEIQIGLFNDKLVVIEEGLKEGDQVVQDVVKYRDWVDLPEIE